MLCTNGLEIGDDVVRAHPAILVLREVLHKSLAYEAYVEYHQPERRKQEWEL